MALSHILLLYFHVAMKVMNLRGVLTPSEPSLRASTVYSHKRTQFMVVFLSRRATPKDTWTGLFDGCLISILSIVGRRCEDSCQPGHLCCSFCWRSVREGRGYALYNPQLLPEEMAQETLQDDPQEGCLTLTTSYVFLVLLGWVWEQDNPCFSNQKQASSKETIGDHQELAHYRIQTNGKGTQEVN